MQSYRQRSIRVFVKNSRTANPPIFIPGVVPLGLSDSFEDQARKQNYISFFQQNRLDYAGCTHPYGTPALKMLQVGHPNGEMNTYWAACILRHRLEKG